jgi:hypothetical protein
MAILPPGLEALPSVVAAGLEALLDQPLGPGLF